MESADFFFHHKHPLILNEAIDETIRCVACKEYLSSPAYTCSDCEFNIHQSCAQLPQKIENPYHRHPLTLLTEPTESLIYCDACNGLQSEMFFHCEKCNFHLDMRCAFWKLTADEGQDQLHHFTHLHPLIAIEKKQEQNDDNNYGYCKICGQANTTELYGCSHCNYYLHRSCVELPQTLQHFYHPCLLTLCLDRQESQCQACDRSDYFYFYICELCNFALDISCALLPLVMESLGQQQFFHFNHGHPLKLTEMKHGDEILCSACQKICSGQTYVCCNSFCLFILHDSCFNLPQKICHPFHPPHPLTLYEAIQPNPKCEVCYRFCEGFTYSCDCCEFHMDVECRHLRSTSSIKYQGHHHNIFFMDGLDPFQPADPFLKPPANRRVCGVCGDRVKFSEAMFHCSECDFHLHLKCGPLPSSIKHVSHPYCYLKLIDSPVIVEGEDKDTDEFYCDTCEKKRDPHLAVYYCSVGCAYIAEIKCVISEILLSLRGEYGQIELRSGMFKHEAGKMISKGIDWQDSKAENETECGKLEVINPNLAEDTITHALSEPGKIEIKNAFELSSNPGTWGPHDNLAFSCSDQDYATFMDSMNMSYKIPSLRDRWTDEELNYGKFLDLGATWTNEELVRVGNHLVISKLVPFFEKLCAKYGDIILESNAQGSDARMFFINCLCQTIRGMYITRVVDMSEGQLFWWRRRLRMLQYVGYKVEFALDRLKRVANAYYALQAERTAEADSKQIDREIVEAYRQINKWEAKLMELKEKRKSKETPKPASSGTVAECFKEISVLKWMRVGDGLL